MKKGIHPKNYRKVNVTCSCGETFETSAVYDKDTIVVDICSKCHPYYTGKQKLIDTEGRVDKFKNRFGAFSRMNKPKKED